MSKEDVGRKNNNENNNLINKEDTMERHEQSVDEKKITKQEQPNKEDIMKIPNGLEERLDVMKGGINEVHSDYVLGYGTISDKDDPLTHDILKTNFILTSVGKERVMVIKDKFLDDFTWDEDTVVYSKFAKRVKRLLNPDRDVRKMEVVDKEEFADGIVYNVRKDNWDIRVGIFPVNKEDLPPVDGISLGSMKFANLFELDAWDITEVITMTPEGQGKGHVCIVPYNLPHHVDLLILDPKPELRLAREDWILVGIGTRNAEGEAVLKTPKRASLNIQTITNFLSSPEAMKVVSARARSELKEIDTIIPSFDAPISDVVDMIKDLSVHDPVLRALEVRRKEKNIPLLAAEVNTAITDIRLMIDDVVGSGRRGPRIHVDGFHAYPIVDPNFIINGEDLISPLEEKYGCPIVIAPHVKEVTDAIVVREPSSRGEYFKVKIIPTNLFPNYPGLNEESGAVLMSARNIPVMMEILGDGDQDDRCLFIVDEEIMKHFNLDKPVTMNLRKDDDSKPILGGFSKSFDYLMARRTLGWNIGMIVNGIMISNIILADEKLRELNKDKLGILEAFSHISASECLDFEKLGIVNETSNYIGSLLKALGTVEYIPAYFYPRGIIDNRYVKELFNRHTRNRIFVKAKSVFGDFSLAMYDLFRYANIIINHARMLSWKAKEESKEFVLKYATHAKLVSPFVFYKNRRGRNIGNVRVLGDKFWAVFKHTNGIAYFNRMLGFWNSLVNIFIRFNEPYATRYAERAADNFLRSAGGDEKVVHGLIRSVRNDPVRPSLQQMLAYLFRALPSFKEQLGLPADMDDVTALGHCMIESIAIAYRERNTRNVTTIGTQSYMQIGLPTSEITSPNSNIDRLNRIATYRDNVILRFNDNILSLFMKAVIFINGGGTREMLADRSPEGRRSFRKVFEDYADSREDK